MMEIDAQLGGERGRFHCSICDPDLASSPKIAPCFHNFCATCLRRHLGSNVKVGQKITCPICDKTLVVPKEEEHRPHQAGMTEDLAWYVHDSKSKHCVVCKYQGKLRDGTHSCRTCGDTFCRECAGMHTALRATKTHRVVEKIGKAVQYCVVCRYRGTASSATYICTTCGDTFCRDCAGLHVALKATKNHAMVEIKPLGDSSYHETLKQKRLCHKHPDKAVASCPQCQVTICPDCGMLDHACRGQHSPMSATEARQNCNEDLNQRLDIIRNLMTGLLTSENQK